MKIYTPSATRVWNLAGAGLGERITVNGSSDPSGWQIDPSKRTHVDLRDIADVWLAVSVSAISGSGASLQVQLDVYDDDGNLYPAQLQLAAALTATGTASIAGGLHVATKPLVLPQWGQVSWTVAGSSPSITAQISLYGR